MSNLKTSILNAARNEPNEELKAQLLALWPGLEMSTIEVPAPVPLKPPLLKVVPSDRYKCGLCDKGFKFKSQFERHILKHAAKPVPVPEQTADPPPAPELEPEAQPDQPKKRKSCIRHVGSNHIERDINGAPFKALVHKLGLMSEDAVVAAMKHYYGKWDTSIEADIIKNKSRWELCRTYGIQLANILAEHREVTDSDGDHLYRERHISNGRCIAFCYKLYRFNPKLLTAFMMAKNLAKQVVAIRAFPAHKNESIQKFTSRFLDPQKKTLAAAFHLKRARPARH